jgi:hypothetical protein
MIWGAGMSGGVLRDSNKRGIIFSGDLAESVPFTGPMPR